MAGRHVPETRDPMSSGRLDLPGAVLAALGLAGTTYALIEGPGDVSPLIVLAGAGGVVALIAFLITERRSANPMMPLGMFSSRQFSAANLVTFAVYAALGGFFFLLRRLPPDLARLLADRRRRRLVAGDAADAGLLGPFWRARSAHRPEGPAHRRPAGDRRGAAADDDGSIPATATSPACCPR